MLLSVKKFFSAQKNREAIFLGVDGTFRVHHGPLRFLLALGKYLFRKVYAPLIIQSDAASLVEKQTV